MVTGTRPVTGLTNSSSTGPLPPCWQSPPSSAQLAVEGVAARSRRGSSWWSSAFERLEPGRPNGTVSKRQSRPSPQWSRGPGPGHVFQQDAHNTTGGEGADEAEGKGLALAVQVESSFRWRAPPGPPTPRCRAAVRCSSHVFLNLHSCLASQGRADLASRTMLTNSARYPNGSSPLAPVASSTTSS